jgi:hypothetical protein
MRSWASKGSFFGKFHKGREAALCNFAEFFKIGVFPQKTLTKLRKFVNMKSEKEFALEKSLSE